MGLLSQLSLSVENKAAPNRIDDAFLPSAEAGRMRRCDVMDAPGARKASDHLPLVVELDVSGGSPSSSRFG